MIVTVAAAQIACRAGDLAGNLDLHVRAMEEARGRQVDLLVFPELSLHDYVSEPDQDQAIPAGAGALIRLAAVTRRSGLVAAVGFMERDGPGKPYNACAVLAEGRVVHVHRKVNLPHYGRLVERSHFRPGERVGTAMTRLGPLATLICADTWNPALPWLAALRGAEILAVPVASAHDAVDPAFDSREGWTVNLRHAALTYGLPVVMANHCGRRGELDFWGGSAVFDAHGRELARAGGEPAIVAAEIDLDDGLVARTRLPTVRDADPALVRAEIERLLTGPVSARPGEAAERSRAAG